MEPKFFHPEVPLSYALAISSIITEQYPTFNIEPNRNENNKIKNTINNKITL